MRAFPSAFLPRPWLARLLRVLLIAGFVWLVARHWHPYYGFTRFLQADADVAGKIVPSLRAAPIFVHPYPGSYDGFYYAEIATDPSLRAPGLAHSVDDLGYRARRILLSALAWALGGGDPVAAGRAYAWLNPLAWLALAIVLWRLLPASDSRATCAWVGVLFATGTLVSVRFALTDLAALLFLALALARADSAATSPRVGAWLGLAALARDTALLGLASLLPARNAPRRPLALAVALAVLPCLVWLGYVRLQVGSSGAGLNNFDWPLLGALRKSADLLAAWRAGQDRWLVVRSAAALLALFVQFAYVLRPTDRPDPYRRLGLAFGALLLCLGPAVWGDDLPGAAVRVLLPLTLAFNLLAVRRRAHPLWLVLGNLSVLGGVPTLLPVAVDPHEFAAGRFAGGSYVVHTSEAFYGVERHRAARWAWSRGSAGLVIETWPRQAPVQQLTLTLDALAPREVEISAGDRTLWRGTVDRRRQAIVLDRPPVRDGRIELFFRTATPPSDETSAPDSRPLAFSLGGVALD